MNNYIYLVAFSECFVGIDVDIEEVKAFTSSEKANAYCDFLNKQFLAENGLEPDDTSDGYIVIPIPFEND